MAKGVGRARDADEFGVERLAGILRENAWFMAVLRVVCDVDPPNWVVGAGVIRNFVWDRLHGFTDATPIRDVDVAYFAEDDVTGGRDEQIVARLRDRRPDVPWEVTHQAGVQLWYEAKFGYRLAVTHEKAPSDDAPATPRPVSRVHRRRTRISAWGWTR